MPYREATGEAPCHQCERPAKNTCPCCARPSCARHLLADKQMCGKCDEAHYIFQHREDGTGVGRQMLVLGVVSAVPAIISMTLLPFTVGSFVLGLPVVLWVRSRNDRRTFRHLMRTRGALPDVGPKYTADELALQNYETKIDERKALEFQASFEASDDPKE